MICYAPRKRIERKQLFPRVIGTEVAENTLDHGRHKWLQPEHRVLTGKERCLSVFENLPHRTRNRPARDKQQLHFVLIEIPKLLQRFEEGRLHCLEILELIKNERDRLRLRALEDKIQSLLKRVQLRRSIQIERLGDGLSKLLKVLFRAFCLRHKNVDKRHALPWQCLGNQARFADAATTGDHGKTRSPLQYGLLTASENLCFSLSSVELHNCLLRFLILH